MRISPLLLFIYPLLELWVLIKVGASIGALNTIFLLIGSSVLGSFLLRTQGLKAALAMRQKIANGALGGEDILRHIGTTFAGLLLIIPGFITSTIGLLLLLPPVRHLIARRFVNNFRKRNPQAHGEFNVYEGEFTRASNEPQHKPENILEAEFTVVDDNDDDRSKK